MLQMNLEYLNDTNKVKDIIAQAQEILTHRNKMYERYSRLNDEKEIKVPLEYYIGNIASGYMGGREPSYIVKQESDDNKKNIVKRLLDKVVGANANKEEFQLLIDYIKDYNDNATFFYEVVKDYLITGAGCWLEYENEDNEIVYTRSSSLQSVAIYDYSLPSQKIGGIRIWTEKDVNNKDVTKAEFITILGKRYFVGNGSNYTELVEEAIAPTWSLVPFNSVENPEGIAIFEPVITMIDTFENVIKNNKNIFEYNDKAKLKITGFTPMNDLFIADDKGNMVKNPARAEEDALIQQAPTFYTPDKDGDIEWIMKDINDTASENHKKTLLELIFLISSVPNIMEAGTGEKTATEIERSFFPLEQYLIQADKLFKKELLSMWENIVARINLKKNTNFDFREIQIDLQRNLPQDKTSQTDLVLKLRELLSDKTVISMLPYDLDVESEVAKKKEEAEENFQENMSMMIAQEPVEDEEDVETTGQITK